MSIRNRSKCAATIIALCLGTVATSAAQAACTQADLTGNWVLHGVGYDGKLSNTVQCPINIKATGRIAAGAACTGNTVNSEGDFEGGDSKTAGGKVTAKSNCKVVGKIRLKVDREVSQNGVLFNLTGISVVTIESAQLSQDKEILTSISREVFTGELTNDEIPEPIPLSSKSVIYSTLNKK